MAGVVDQERLGLGLDLGERAHDLLGVRAWDGDGLRFDHVRVVMNEVLVLPQLVEGRAHDGDRLVGRLRRHQGAAEHRHDRIAGGAHHLVELARRLLAAVHAGIELLEGRHLRHRAAARIAAVLGARRHLPERHHHRPHRRLHGGAPARQRRVRHLPVVLQDRGLDLLEAAIGGHGLVLDAEQVERERLVDGVGILRIERERLERLRLHDVGADRDPGRRVLADIGHQRVLHAREHHEVRVVDAQRRVADDLRDDVEREEADGLPVGRGLGKLVGADDAAGAGDVLDDDGRLARNMLGQVLGDDAALDVRRATGGVVDDHGHGLALVELGKRAIRRSDDREGDCSSDG